jgi:hypothetical protein
MHARAAGSDAPAMHAPPHVRPPPPLRQVGNFSAATCKQLAQFCNVVYLKQHGILLFVQSGVPAKSPFACTFFTST